MFEAFHRLKTSRREVMARGTALATAGLISPILGSAQPEQAPLAPKPPVRGTASPGDRPAFWPGNARLVISVSMQFEAGAQGEHADGPFPRLEPKYPDSITPTWYAYGMREGVPRLLDLWDRFGVKVTSHMVGRAVDLEPKLAREIVERGHEAAAHGQTWTPQYSMTPEEERASYLANIASIERATGTRPLGFNAFWMRQTPHTLKLLQELGFSYHIDDLSRDEPSIRILNGKPFAVVPYTLRNNDIARFDNPAMTAAAFAQELKDEFDVLYAEAQHRRRMMSVSVHDRIGGTPARVKALGEFIAYAQKQPGVVFLRKDAISRWALAQADTPREAGAR
ncbi:polysaccharide deacetylase family protein [Stigmatella sp. ncwal1]|uniref:Polysaccharide deacetylase family protein n=1 Tax=Stigmatella ashevillensis TaxID=2995309 RepID=A0ABT5D824_9BACT|nr:polysaccharide deacetylase family protein [Stigmatella ashevillena]MDC0709807.1 polysaccharide deacetylase family protein [Stigmatella ashevillena]